MATHKGFTKCGTVSDAKINLYIGTGIWSDIDKDSASNINTASCANVSANSKTSGGKSDTGI